MARQPFADAASPVSVISFVPRQAPVALSWRGFRQLQVANMPIRTIPRILPPDGCNELAACRDGVMLFNRNDTYVGASLRKYGEWSAAELDVFRQVVQSGQIVVEVGANIGAHTIALSRMVGPTGGVLAFEPQRLVFQTLCANLALNSCVNVAARQEAVGASAGQIMVPILPPDQPNNFGALPLANSWQHGEPVPVVTIDSLRLTACRLLKLDIEGMEFEALQGACDTIRRLRPALYVENERDDRSPALITLLLSHSYRLYWHAPFLFTPNNFAGDRENIFGRIASHNMLCVPREAAGAIDGLVEVSGPQDSWRNAPSF
jgi:FkbM family methyltransferase